jgi:hypothetical protein
MQSDYAKFRQTVVLRRNLLAWIWGVSAAGTKSATCALPGKRLGLANQITGIAAAVPDDDRAVRRISCDGAVLDCLEGVVEDATPDESRRRSP